MAFRLEPMQNAVDAAAWLGFHVVLEMFGVKAAAAVDSDRPGQVFREDRRCVCTCTCIHACMHTVRKYIHCILTYAYTHTWIRYSLSSPQPITVWNQSSIVRCYQDPTLDAFSRHVVKQRNKVLRKVRDQPALSGDVVVGATEAGKAQSMIMTPRLWFWHKFHMRPVPEDENKSLKRQLDRIEVEQIAQALDKSLARDQVNSD